MSPTHFPSNTPPENDPSSGPGDELAKAFYQTAKKAENASTRIEAALKIFCDDFSVLVYQKGSGNAVYLVSCGAS